MGIWKKLISGFLAVVMVISMLPVQAFAEEEPDTEETTVEATVVTEPEETEPPHTAPTETEATEEPATVPIEPEAPTTAPVETEEPTEPEKSTEETEATEETTEKAMENFLSAVNSGQCGTDVFWQLDDNGTLTIWGEGEMATFASEQTAPWNKDRASIRSVVIESGVTSIGAFSFSNCTNLASVKIASTVTSIGAYVFNNCPSLRGVTLPENITWMGYGVFYDCTDLTSLTIPAPMKSVPGYTFKGCTALKSVKLPEGITAIDVSAFEGCSSLTDLTIPAGITQIGGSAFEGCSSLTMLAIPSGVTYIGSSAFTESGITDIKIPDGVRKIDFYAFKNCVNLSSVVLPDSIETIGWNAFEGCVKLTQITLPENLTTIDDGVFADSGLEKIAISPSVKTLGEGAFSGCKNLKRADIKASLMSISARLFEGCSSLTEVNIPDGVTVIEASAFAGCSSLAKLDLPNSITTIEDNAFAGEYPSLGCGFQSFVIPDSVTTIGSGLFRRCCNLKEIKLPAGITKISDGMFEECGFETFTVPNTVTEIGEGAFRACEKLVSVTISDGVTQIGDGAFYWCSHIENIAIPESVTHIGAYAFHYCDSLNTLLLPSGITRIEEGTFMNCTHMRSFKIPDGVTYVGESAFENCWWMLDFTIPSSVTFFGNRALAGLGQSDGPRYSKVYYTGTEESWEDIVFGELNEYVFDYNVELIVTGGSSASLGGMTSSNVGASEIDIYVYDAQTAKVIPNAEITIEGDSGTQTATTREDGHAAFAKPSGKYMVKIQNDEYTYLELADQQLKAGKTARFGLWKASKKPVIQKVIYSESGADILSQKVTLREQGWTSFTLTATASFLSDDSDYIAKYQLIQGGSVIKESEDGVFAGLTTSDFAPEQKVYIQAISANEIRGARRQTNLLVKDGIFRDPVTEGNFSFGEAIEITLDSNIPFLGGQKISLKLCELPMQIETDGDKVRIGINLYSKESGEEGSFFMDSTWDSVVDSTRKNLSFKDYMNKYNANRIQQAKGGLPFVDVGSSKVTYEVWGYLEGDGNKLEGELAIQLGWKGGSEYQFFPWGVPMIVSIEMDASGEGSVKVDVVELWTEFSDDKAVTSGKFNPSFTISVGAGPGIADIASATVNGSGKLNYVLTLDRDVGASSLLDLTLRGYIKLKLLFASYEKTLVKKTWTLIDTIHGNRTVYSSVPMPVTMASLNNMSLNSRSYLSSQTGWMGGRMTYGWDTQTGLLQGSVYDDPNIQLVTCGNTVMAFFLTDDGTRADIDRTKLVYTVFDQNAGMWREPVAVENDGTADFLPNAYSDGSNVYVTWVDMKSKVPAEMDMVAVPSLTEIKAAKLESDGTFTVTTLTDDDTYDTMPAILSDGGKVYVAWVNNSANDLLCVNGENQLVLATLDGGETKRVNVGTVTGLTLAQSGGKVTAACLTDRDKDFFTEEDKALTLYTMDGERTGSYQGRIAEVRNGIYGLTWLQDSILTNGSGSVMGLEAPISSTYQILETAARIYVLFLGSVPETNSDLTDTELFAYIYDKGAGVWSNAVQLSQVGENIQQICSFVDQQGTIRSLMSVANFDLAGESYVTSTDLCHMSLQTTADIQLNELNCLDVINEDGQDVLYFHSSVANTGADTISGYQLTLSQGGSVLSTVSVDKLLPGGTPDELDGKFVLPSVVSGLGDYTVSVLCSETESNTGNNSKTIQLGKPDFQVSYEANCNKGLHVLTVNVENMGRSAASGTLNVRRGSESGEVLFSAAVPSLNPGAMSNYILTLNADVVGAVTENELIFLCVESGADEASSGNNSNCYVMTQKDDFINAITLYPEQRYLHVGDSIRLSPDVDHDIVPDDSEITYSSSNPAAATVDSSGLVTAVSQGNAEITVSIGKHHASCYVYVSGHDYLAVITPPTCTTGGSTAYDCQICGSSYVGDYTDPLGHDWNEKILDAVHLKSEEDGCQYYWYDCTRCNAVSTDEYYCYIPVPTDVSFVFDREYLAMHAGDSQVVALSDIEQAPWSESITWSLESADGAEDSENIAKINIAEDNLSCTITASGAGTTYLVARRVSVGDDLVARCRIDVTDADVIIEEDITEVKLATTSATSELYKTDYAQIKLFMDLEQNKPAPSMDAFTTLSAPENNGAAVTGARFGTVGSVDLSQYFDLVAKDDSTLLVVPTDYAVQNPKEVKASYSKVPVYVTVGSTEMEAGLIKLTVKKTVPKLKAANITLNSFLSGDSQTLTFTGGKVLSVEPAAQLPDVLALNGFDLSLTDAIRVSCGGAGTFSGKLALNAEVEGYRLTWPVTVSVKASQTLPRLALSASTVTLYNGDASKGLALKLVSKQKGVSVADLGVTGIEAPDGYTVEYHEDGSFLLKPEGTPTAETIILNVLFGHTQEPMPLKLKIKTANVTAKLSISKLTLNPTLVYSAPVGITFSPADFDPGNLEDRITVTDKAGSDMSSCLTVTYDGGVLHVATTGETEEQTTYYVHIPVGGKDVKLTVNTLSVKKAAISSTLKASGAIDLSFPDHKDKEIVIKPTYKNYVVQGNEDFGWEIRTKAGDDAGDLFDVTIDADGTAHVKADGLTETQLKTQYFFRLVTNISGREAPVYSSAVKLSVRKTTLVMKLAKTSISLNAEYRDEATIKLTSGTRDFGIKNPYLEYPDALDVSYANGELHIALNPDLAESGKTYKVILRADEELGGKTVTLAVKTPAKTAVTAKAKAKGSIDVIRPNTFVTLTPTVSNFLGQVKYEVKVVDAKTLEPVQGFRVVPQEDGTFRIYADGSVEHSRKYKVEVTAILTSKDGTSVTTKPAYVGLTVKMGSVKLTVDKKAVTLYAKDRYSSETVCLTKADTALNGIETVSIKKVKGSEAFTVRKWGEGKYAICFADNITPDQLPAKPIKLTLEVTFKGNNTGKPNMTIPVTVNILK